MNKNELKNFNNNSINNNGNQTQIYTKMKTTITLKKNDENLTSYLLRCILLIFVLNTSIVLGQSSSCNAELKVEKDRNTRSTPQDGTFYAMVLTNKGNATDVFHLSALNLTDCTNTDGSDGEKNVKLDPVFLDSNRNPITEISVSRGQTVSFFVHILVPANTPYNKWNCTQITAKPKLCNNYQVNTILHTLVINPNEQ